MAVMEMMLAKIEGATGGVSGGISPPIFAAMSLLHDFSIRGCLLVTSSFRSVQRNFFVNTKMWH
jgi:hypothetical protein